MNNQANAKEFLENGYLEEAFNFHNEWSIEHDGEISEEDPESDLLEGAWWEVIIPDDDYVTTTGKWWVDPEYYDGSRLVIIDDPCWAYSIKEAGVIDLPEGATIVSHDYINGATIGTASLCEVITVDVLNIRTNYKNSVADCCGDNSDFITERED